jgi:hypothetical protein
MEDNNSKELYKLVKQVKANLHLEKCRIRGQYMFNEDIISNLQYKDEIIHKEIMMRLSEEAFKNFSNLIETKKENGLTEKSLDLMVFPTNFFKEIVEQVIILTPIEIINSLKNK